MSQSSGNANVHHGLAAELVAVLLDCLGDRRVVEGEHDEVAAEAAACIDGGRAVAQLSGERLRVLRIAVDDLDLVAARDRAHADPAPHVPAPMMVTFTPEPCLKRPGTGR